MNKTRLSLYYPATYLTVAGLSLLLAPQLSLKLLLSNGEYGDVFPRVAGMMILGLGLIVIQVIRLRQEQLYSTLWAIRLLFCIGWFGFHLDGGQSFARAQEHDNVRPYWVDLIDHLVNSEGHQVSIKERSPGLA